MRGVQLHLTNHIYTKTKRKIQLLYFAWTKQVSFRVLIALGHYDVIMHSESLDCFHTPVLFGFKELLIYKKLKLIFQIKPYCV